MKKLIFTGAMIAALVSPVAAQTAQEKLDARHDRALAAGYKALFLCSAVANAEANGAERSPEDIHKWELTGIYPKLDPIIRDLEYKIVRRPTGQVAHVQVKWADDAPERLAVYYGPESGCAVLPIGAPVEVSNAAMPMEMPPKPEVSERQKAIDAQRRKFEELGISGSAHGKLIDPNRNYKKPLSSPIMKAMAVGKGGNYGKGARTTAVIVRKLDTDAKLDFQVEMYAPGFSRKTPQRTWSVAKSLAATFVGMAVHSGEYSVTDPVGLNYWQSGGPADQRNAITIDIALRMASGRYSDTPGNRTDPIYWGGGTVNEYATHWPVVHTPGTVYRYANNDTLIAVKAIERYLGFYKPVNLLKSIGLENTVVETDWTGGYVLSSQVWATADDLASLGALYLRNGVAPDGSRVLPENWREYVSSPSGPQPEGTQWGYGAGWWTFRRPDGNTFEGIPDDAFAARGNRGQYVVVVPSRNVVIVRRGEDMVGTRFNIAAFTKDVLAALEE